MRRWTILFLLFLLIACDGGETAVSDPAPPEENASAPVEGDEETESATAENEAPEAAESAPANAADGAEHEGETDTAAAETIGLIAFSGETPDTEDDIYLMDSQGNNLVNLTNTPQEDDGYPVWSPDGGEILWPIEVADDGTTELFVMAPDGSGKRQLTTLGWDINSPSWSPDGERILFAGEPVDGNWDLYLINRDGGGLEQLTDAPGRDWEPHWSPDGAQILFVSDRNGARAVFVMGVDGSNLQQLTFDAENARRPRWSPDGTQIVYWLDGDARSDIVLMNADGSDPRVLVPHPEGNRHPNWSVDGRFILFSSARSGSWQLYVTDPAGTKLRRFNLDAEISIDVAAVQPAGGALVALGGEAVAMENPAAAPAADTIFWSASDHSLADRRGKFIADASWHFRNPAFRFDDSVSAGYLGLMGRTAELILENKDFIDFSLTPLNFSAFGYAAKNIPEEAALAFAAENGLLSTTDGTEFDEPAFLNTMWNYENFSSVYNEDGTTTLTLIYGPPDLPWPVNEDSLVELQLLPAADPAAYVTIRGTGLNPQTYAQEARSYTVLDVSLDGETMTIRADGRVLAGSLISFAPGLLANPEGIPLQQTIMTPAGWTMAEEWLSQRAVLGPLTPVGGAGVNVMDAYAPDPTADDGGVFGTAVAPSWMSDEEKSAFYVDQVEQMFLPLVEAGEIHELAYLWNMSFLRETLRMPEAGDVDIRFNGVLGAPATAVTDQFFGPAGIFGPGDIDARVGFVIANLLLILEAPGNGYMGTPADFRFTYFPGDHPRALQSTDVALSNPLVDAFLGNYYLQSGTIRLVDGVIQDSQIPNKWRGVFRDSYVRQISADPAANQRPAYIPGYAGLPNDDGFGGILDTGARNPQTELYDSSFGVSRALILPDEVAENPVYNPYTLAVFMIEKIMGQTVGIQPAFHATWAASGLNPADYSRQVSPTLPPNSGYEEYAAHYMGTLAWMRLVALNPGVIADIPSARALNLRGLTVLNTIGSGPHRFSFGYPGDNSLAPPAGYTVIPGSIHEGDTVSSAQAFVETIAPPPLAENWRAWAPSAQGSIAEMPFLFWLTTYTAPNRWTLLDFRPGDQIDVDGNALSTVGEVWNYISPFSDREASPILLPEQMLLDDNTPLFNDALLAWMSDRAPESMVKPEVALSFARALELSFSDSGSE